MDTHEKPVPRAAGDYQRERRGQLRLHDDQKGGEPRGEDPGTEAADLAEAIDRVSPRVWQVVGAGLVLSGLSRRSMPGLLIAGLGGALLYRGCTRSERSRGEYAGEAEAWRRAKAAGRDVVQEASEDSFPASDAPGWTSSATT